jgi:hypothetical protein
MDSYVRPGKLFTAHTSLIAGQAGQLQPLKYSAVRDAVVRMIQNGS